MDVLKAIQSYVNKAVSETSGIKVLLLDAETVRSLSLLSFPSLIDTPHLSSLLSQLSLPNGGLDKQTPIISLATTQSHLLQHEIYLTDRIDNPSRAVPSAALSNPSASSSSVAYPPTASRGVERLPHLKCVCILRPTDESIEQCERELREGRYGGYWLCTQSLSPYRMKENVLISFLSFRLYERPQEKPN